MTWFKREPREQQVTGVGAILSASHTDGKGGLHGHTWEITVWFPYRYHMSALTLQSALQKVVSSIDHTILPSSLSHGEALAKWIAASFDLEPVQVDVNRPAERIYAKWRALS